MIIAKSLPHSIGYSSLPDGNVRKVVMELNENVTSLHLQLKEVQAVCKNGVGSGKSVNVESLAEDVAPLVASTVIAKTAEATAAATTATQKAEAASVSAGAAEESEENAAASETAANEYANGKTVEGVVTVDGALQYKNAAQSSAQAAALSETNAGTSETNAANSATAADEYANGKYESGTLTVNGAKQYKEAAETARDRAEIAAANTLFVTTLGYNNLDLGADTYTKFFMDGIVIDTTKTYDVKVTFNNTYTNTYTCSVTAYDSEGAQTASDSTTVQTRSGSNYKGSASVVVNGDGFFKVDNSATYVDVIIQIKEHIS